MPDMAEHDARAAEHAKGWLAAVGEGRGAVKPRCDPTGSSKLPRMSKNVAAVVMRVLAEQLRFSGEELDRRRDEGLDRLGLDSHGLMRVLLDIERALELTQSLEVEDEALGTPATLVAGVLKVLGQPAPT